MLRPRLQGKIPITLVCIVLGMMLAVQFRTTKEIGSTARFQRAEDLVKQITRVEKERDALLNEVQQIRDAKDGGTASPQTASIKAGAGLIPLNGPGVIVTMDEGKLPVASGKNPNLYLIKDEDILKILNELRAAGAEAISLNGQRLVASSEIRTVGNALSVNNIRTAPPYEIKAIGEPDTLENSLRLRGGVIETLQVWGILVTVKKQPNVLVPAYKGGFRFEYAKPLEEK